MRAMKRIAALALGLSIVTACTAAQPGATTAPTASGPAVVKQIDLLKIGTTSDESSWNPYTYVSGYPGWTFLLMQFDTLMAFDLNNEPTPWLAKQVQVSADNKVWTLTLESGVKWHDGKPFGADDVKFTIEYLQKNIHGRFSTPLRDVEKVEIQGTDKVVITTKAAKPGFRTQALADIPMMPKHVWETYTGDPKKAVDLKFSVGTGPYKLVEYKTDQLYRFQANEDYFKGKPLVKEIVMPVVKEAAPAFASVKTGDLDTTVRALQPELLKDFESTAGIKVVRGADYATQSIWVNVERKGLDRKEVRQAISLAIDRKKLSDTVFLGAATIGSDGFVHPENAFANKSIKTEFDVAKANRLLDSIGAAKGADGTRVLNGTPLKYEMLVSSTGGPLRLRLAELSAQMLKEVGITITPKVVESTAWTAAVWPEFDVRKGRNYDMTMQGWSAPTQFEAGRLVEQIHSDPLVGSLNVYGFKDAAGDKLAEQLRDEGDPEKRKALAQQMQAYFADQVPIITLLYADGLYAYRSTVFDGYKFQKGLGIFQKSSFIAPK
jgi:peptide/nickel transport system substrate-binding protein